jgi:hypothetical protein
MYLTYLGESGNTGNSLNDANQPHHVHVGLLIHESQSVSMNGEFNALYRRHFGRPPGEPGGPKGIRASDVYQGMGAFSSWLPTKRHELIQDCFDILLRRETPVIVSYVNKEEFAQARARDDDPSGLWQSPSEPVIRRFLVALTLFMEELSISGMDSQQIMAGDWPIKDFALVLASDSRSVDPGFLTQFLGSEDGMDASSLMENFGFVSREHAVGTQLAQMCAYFTRRWLQNPSGSNPYFDALRDGNVVQVIYPVQL